MSNHTNWSRAKLRPHVYEGSIRKPEGSRYQVTPKKNLPYTIVSDKSIDQLRAMEKYSNCEIEKVN